MAPGVLGTVSYCCVAYQNSLLGPAVVLVNLDCQTLHIKVHHLLKRQPCQSSGTGRVVVMDWSHIGLALHQR